MAVYTQVSDEALAAFLAEYDLGTPLSFKGIAEGVENSNYYLETSTGRYILTLFEKRVNAADLPYFIGLKQHLAATQKQPPRAECQQAQLFRRKPIEQGNSPKQFYVVGKRHDCPISHKRSAQAAKSRPKGRLLRLIPPIRRQGTSL